MSVVVAANEIVSHFGKTFHQVRENPVNHLLSMVCKKMQVWSRALPMEQFGKRPKTLFSLFVPHGTYCSLQTNQSRESSWTKPKVKFLVLPPRLRWRPPASVGHPPSG